MFVATQSVFILFLLIQHESLLMVSHSIHPCDTTKFVTFQVDAISQVTKQKHVCAGTNFVAADPVAECLRALIFPYHP